MKIEITERRYHWSLRLLVIIPMLAVIGLASLMAGALFMAIGALMTSPVWIPLMLVGWLP
jgi:hypothetical protein